jgi:signal transduction histidine kinase
LLRSRQTGAKVKAVLARSRALGARLLSVRIALQRELTIRPKRLLAFTLGGIGVAFALVLIPPNHDRPGLLVAAAAVGAALILVALACPLAPRAANLAVPLGYLVMVALLRSAEGGSSSGFGGLFLVPIIWLALTSGPAEVALGLIGMVLAQTIPLLVVGAPEYPFSGWRATLVLTTVAGIAGITIQVLLSETRTRARENARLYESAALWSRRLESLAEVANALAGELELEPLLDMTAARLRELLSARLVVVLLPEGEQQVRCAAAAGEGARELVDRLLPREYTHAGAVLDSTTARLDNSYDGEFLPGRPSLWVPLLSHDRAIGVLAAFESLETTDGEFTHGDLRLAEIFAARASLAAELSERVAADAVRRVVSAQEAERRRLARELHDETGQALTTMLMQLKSLEERSPDVPIRTQLAALRETVVDTLRGVRRIVVELRPKALDDLGLVPALERLAASYSEQTGLDVNFNAGDFSERLPPELETALYRITQEGLTNVVKHAHATEATVLLAPTGESVLLVIADDGCGFDAALTAARGFGIDGMRERVQLLGGKLAIESSASGNTALTIEVPVS